MTGKLENINNKINMKTLLKLSLIFTIANFVISCSKTDSEEDLILNEPTIVAKWEYSKQSISSNGPFTDYPVFPNCAKKNEEFKENYNAILKEYSGIDCTETIKYAIYEINGNQLKTTASNGRGFTIRTILSISNSELKLHDGDIFYLMTKKI